MNYDKNSAQSNAVNAMVSETVTLHNSENSANTIVGLDYKYYEGNWNALTDFTSLKAIKTGAVATPDLTTRTKND